MRVFPRIPQRFRPRRRPGVLEEADRLVRALSARDEATGMHVNRVACIATEIGILQGLEEPELLPVEIGARLHDLGKIGIPDAILRKPGPLTDSEWEVMRRHPDIGAAVLGTVPSLRDVIATVRAHHERWDGAGYPEGLSGDTIPLEARIFALADSIDAMTSDRPYRQALPWSRVQEELLGGVGTQWDPTLTMLTLQSLPRLIALERGCPHGRGPKRGAA